MSRTLHRSVLLGLVLAGPSPIWVRPEVDAATGLPRGVPPAAIERRRGEPRPIVGPASYRVDPVTVLPPRTAFFAHAETVPIDAAAGRTSAELIAPYPPGIPVLAPGEQVTPGVLEAQAH